MKKLTKNRLALEKEVVRALENKELADVAGGFTGLRCDTNQCPSGICSYWPCSAKSMTIGSC